MYCVKGEIVECLECKVPKLAEDLESASNKIIFLRARMEFLEKRERALVKLIYKLRFDDDALRQAVFDAGREEE